MHPKEASMYSIYIFIFILCIIFILYLSLNNFSEQNLCKSTAYMSFNQDSKIIPVFSFSDVIEIMTDRIKIDKKLI